MKTLMETKWVQALGRHGTPLLFQYANAVGFLSVRNNQCTTVGDQGDTSGSRGLRALFHWDARLFRLPCPLPPSLLH